MHIYKRYGDSPSTDISFCLKALILISFLIIMQANINVRAIAQGCSEYNITVVVKREDCIRALRAVHSRFYLSRTTIAMGIIGPGLIGATLLDQLRDQVIKQLYSSLCRILM